MLLSLIAERLLVRWAEPPWPVLVLGLLAWAPLFPGLLLLAAGWTLLHLLRRSPGRARILAAPPTAWSARAVLTLVFLAAVADLVRDHRALI